MWRLIEFLQRFGNLLLFIGLEALALLLVFTRNNDHRIISEGFFLEVSGKFQKANSSVFGYFNLRAENEKLMAQNSRLESELIRSRNYLATYQNCYPEGSHFTVLPDSIFTSSGFRFLPAKVINNTVDKSYNYLTLDKGRRSGVREGMGIISPDGIVGLVTHVSQNYSLALSLLNKKFRVSAKLQGKQNVGTMSWDGHKPNQGILMYIPQTSEIAIGDTVVTSGYSSVFPEDFVVGTVSGFDTDEQDGFFHIRVDLASDFRSLGNVFLVEHHQQAEIDSLEGLAKEDE
jgi:rod shape-determining protein MreC